MLFYLMWLSKLFVMTVVVNSNGGITHAVTDAYLPNVDDGHTGSDVCVFPVVLISFLIVDCEMFFFVIRCFKTCTDNLSVL